MNEINELIKDVNNVERVQRATSDLNEALRKFLAAHEIYHSQLVDEDDKQESGAYCDVEDAGQLSLHFTDKVAIWLKSCQHGGDDSLSEITPDDSVSNFGSDFGSKISRKSKSKRSNASSVPSSKVSLRSSALNAKAVTAARKAALIEEAMSNEATAEKRTYSEIGALEYNENNPLDPGFERSHSRSQKINLAPSRQNELPGSEARNTLGSRRGRATTATSRVRCGSATRVETLQATEATRLHGLIQHGSKTTCKGCNDSSNSQRARGNRTAEKSK